MAETTGNDGFNDESGDADDYFSGGTKDGAQARRGESLDDILRDSANSDRRDESIANIHTGSKEVHIGAMMEAPPEGAPPPDPLIVEPDSYTPGDPPPPIDPIDVEQEAGGTYTPEERGLDFEFSEGQFREDRVFAEEVRVEDREEIRSDAEDREKNYEELILEPTRKDDDEPTNPSEVDDATDRPSRAQARGASGDRPSGGADGERDARSGHPAAGWSTSAMTGPARSDWKFPRPCRNSKSALMRHPSISHCPGTGLRSRLRIVKAIRSSR